MALRTLSLVRETNRPYSAGLDERLYRIHERALCRARTYRASEADLIDSLREVDDEKIFLKLELTSLYQYAVQILKLSEDVACNLIAIMRRSRAVPELTERIRDGSITASKARKIASVITTDNKSAWLDLASSKTSRQIEKAVAQENPKAAVVESVKYKTAERLEFKIGVSEEWLSALQQVKDLLSQKRMKAVTSEEALKAIMDDFLKRNDPIRRAERVQKRKVESEISEEPKPDNQFDSTDKHPSVPGRQRLPAHTKHAVMLRDQRRCRHLSIQGERCENRRWIDVHHIIPVSDGGNNQIENLITLCSAHHRAQHRADH